MPEERGWLGDYWAFSKYFYSGVWDAAAGTVEGVVELAKGGYALATDDKARESAWNTTKKLAKAAGDYGEEVLDDPAKASRDARDGTLAAYNTFEQAKEKAEAEGRSAEFWGNLTGKVGFEIGTIILGVGVAAKAGKLGKVAKGAKQLENAEDMVSASKRAEDIVKNSDINAPDTDGVKIECPLKDNCGAKKQRLRAEKSTLSLNPDLKDKILYGKIKPPKLPKTKSELIGGHSPKVLDNPNYRYKDVVENADGTVTVSKLSKKLHDGSWTKGKKAKTTIPPKSWSDEKIIDATESVANKPPYQKTSYGKTSHKGNVDGIEWEVVKNANGEIVASYPTGVTQN